MTSFILLIYLVLALLLVLKSADWAIYRSTRLAEFFGLPKYIIGFLVVAVISILPETFIAITSALEGVPAFGLGTLFGSNVADLSLVFALVVLASGRNLKVESRIVKNRFLYTGMIALPLFFGLNGYYTRTEGLLLVGLGILFYLYIFKSTRSERGIEKGPFSSWDVFFLLLSMAGLLLGAYLTVKFGVALATRLQINPILVGMFVVGLGTTLPELFFSIKAARHNHDGLALGDILGTVIADATIVVGIVASISPFAFNPRIVYVSGIFMFAAIALLLHLMRTGRKLTRREALLLVLFYLIFAVTEFITGN